MTDDGLVANDGGSGESDSDLSASEDGVVSSDTSNDSSISLSHSLSDHSGFKFKNQHPDESRYSGTASENLHGFTAWSRSHGTSDNTDNPSILSTVSISEVLPFDFYGANSGTDETGIDSTTGTTIELLDRNGTAGPVSTLVRDPLAATVFEIGGIRWTGDTDNETIFGTDWLDVLYGGGGDDRLYGFEEDDIITGGNGRDRLFGGPGDDLIRTASFANTFLGADNDGDFASGGSGNDRMYGAWAGNVSEVFFGGPGHDIIDATDGDDLVYGDEGDDEITAGMTGSNEIHGGSGDDSIIITRGGTDGNDLHGGEGDDLIEGGDGADDLYGDEGDDMIDGFDGDDEIWGGPGDDILKGGGVTGGTLMQDVLRGGLGDDTLYGHKTNNMFGGGGGTSYWIYGDEGDDEIWGTTDMNEYMWGGAGDDEIHAGPTNDVVFINGNEGDDIIYPGQGPQVSEDINGGKGDDIIGVVDEDLFINDDGTINIAAWDNAT